MSNIFSYARYLYNQTLTVVMMWFVQCPSSKRTPSRLCLQLQPGERRASACTCSDLGPLKCHSTVSQVDSLVERLSSDDSFRVLLGQQRPHQHAQVLTPVDMQ